ncbi:hypothetical protein Scani_27240 [Streptomyces caniferus]|uniref:Glycosyl transferase family 1 domain-containing protein n=1 Tax=Streptomyces caniferus TaxID=285557 RepID=A0A640S7U7_9ACTN|nr:hypothetical protein [Streptomyces caniferus]GFE06456.1 hypothetical protein Scani_27240 [Streptomyces caniferus]
MKIGLIELSAHSEVLDSLIRQAIDVGASPTVYTNPFCAESSEAAAYAAVEWQVCPPGLPYAEFLENCKSSIGSQDHLFIITPVDSLCGSLSDASATSATWHCLVHNLNTFNSSDDNRPSAAIAKLVLDGATGVLLPDLRLRKSGDPLRTHAINIAYPQHPPTEFVRDEVRCCIPGRMYSGRDHAEVLSALEIAAPRLTKRLRVEFLGEHSTEETKAAVEAARKTVVPSVELRDHPGYVAQEEFDRTLAEADFLILPVSEYLTRNGIIETRGQTCVTGNINDMVRFGLPSLMPAFYPLSSHIEGMTARYDGIRSLADLIVTWVNSDEFTRRKRAAAPGLEAYRAECLSAMREQLARC